MCGICGIVDTTSQNRVVPAQVRSMTAAIQHRGPDGDGFYDAPHITLGMRRLSIIDVQGSDQPLYNEDKSIALVFNGELYNYRELQHELRVMGHRLRTDGDGEVLAHLYEQYGLDMFRHIRGMYGFALWDNPRQRLILAVDHIGMKPLYLYDHQGMLYFSSEAKALFAAADVNPTLNLDALDTYLSFGYPLGQDTLFTGVRRLMPGHVLVVEQGRIQETPYWAFGRNFDLSVSPAPASHDDEAAIVEETRRALHESVTLHLRSDVPLGLFLSGGVDSASMLALMAPQIEQQVRTFTVGFTGNSPDNELLQARRIAQHFNTLHHERMITPQDWWVGLQRYAYAHDEPNANPSAISMLLLAEETAQHVKVVLTGLGGDELFGGYWHHRAIPALLRRQAQWAHLPGKTLFEGALRALEPHYPTFKRYRVIGALPTYLPQLRHALLPQADGLRRMQSYDAMVLSDAQRDNLYGGDLAAVWQAKQHKEHVYAQIVQQSWNDDPVRTAQALVINTWLTGNALLSQDKVTMAHSLEARVPFFDPALFALAARLPTELLMRGNKYILREAMRPYLPAFALERPKKPFHTPIRGWFETHLRGEIEAVLRDGGALTRRLFKPAALDALLEAHFSGQQRQEEIIFRLLNLELWHKAFMQSQRVS